MSFVIVTRKPKNVISITPVKSSCCRKSVIVVPLRPWKIGNFIRIKKK
ncbi:MAG: hypothetical protein QW303_04720 [Nitrososphaerota archaeon]